MTGVADGGRPTIEVLPNPDGGPTAPALSSADFLQSIGIDLPSAQKKAIDKASVGDVPSSTDFLKSLGVELPSAKASTEVKSSSDFLSSQLGIELPSTGKANIGPKQPKSRPTHVPKRSTIEYKRTTSHPNKRVNSRRLTPAKIFGIGVLATSTLIGGAVAGFTLMGEKPAASQASRDYEVKPPVTPPTTVKVETAVTVPETTPPTTEAIPEPFKPKVGDWIGRIQIPALCIDGVVMETDAQEAIDGIIGTGRGGLDTLVANPNPPGRCDTVEQRLGAAAFTRHERGDKYLPIFGHSQINGMPRTVYPGEQGNAVLTGHRTMFSRPWTDAEALQGVSELHPGDELIYTQGREVFTFRLIELQNLEATDDDTPFIKYSHPDYKSTVSIYGCSGENRQGGLKTHRLVGRFGLVNYAKL